MQQTIILGEYQSFRGISYDPKAVRTRTAFIDTVRHEVGHLFLGRNTSFGIFASLVEAVRFKCLFECRDPLGRLSEWLMRQSIKCHETWTTTGCYADRLRTGKSAADEYCRSLNARYMAYFQSGYRHFEAFYSVEDWVRAIQASIQLAMSPPLESVLQQSIAPLVRGHNVHDLPSDLSPDQRLDRILGGNILNTMRDSSPVTDASEYVARLAHLTGCKMGGIDRIHKLLTHDLFRPLSKDPWFHHLLQQPEEELFAYFCRPVTEEEAFATVYPEKKNTGNPIRTTLIKDPRDPILKDTADLLLVSESISGEMRQNWKYFANIFDFRKQWEYLVRYTDEDLSQVRHACRSTTTVGTWRAVYDIETRDIVGQHFFGDSPHCVIVHGPLPGAFSFLEEFLKRYPACHLRYHQGDEPTVHHFFAPLDRPNVLLYLPLARTAEDQEPLIRDLPVHDDPKHIRTMHSVNGKHMANLVVFFLEF